MSPYTELLKVVAKIKIRKNLIREYERQKQKADSLEKADKLTGYINETNEELNVLASQEAKFREEIAQLELENVDKENIENP
jgi:cell division FtsZ-interacting protein ZapD